MAAAPPTPGGGDFGHNSANHLHYLAEAQKIAWADRDAYVGDPAFTNKPIPIEMMTSKFYAAKRLAEIDPGAARTSYLAGDPNDTYQDPAATEGGNTTHVSVIDAAGNAAAVTCSIEMPFGSAVVQAIINMVDFAAPLAVAIDAARADAQLCHSPVSFAWSSLGWPLKSSRS